MPLLVLSILTVCPIRKKASKNFAAAFSKPSTPTTTAVSLTALLDEDDVTNRLLAKHPRASTELLEKLSHCSDKATRQNVTGNPNTPPETLVRLGQQFSIFAITSGGTSSNGEYGSFGDAIVGGALPVEFSRKKNHRPPRCYWQKDLSHIAQ